MDTVKIDALRQYIHQKYPDFPAPKSSYLIMMSPRCGSNLLCTHLEQIGFGRPIEAFHFNHRRMKERYHWDIDFNDPVTYMKTAINYQTINGIFGMKMNWNQFETFLKIARKLSDPFNPAIRDNELTEALFPNVSYILMRRRNKVKQAISYSRAMQTGIWREKKDQDESYKDYVLTPVYDREHIEGCLDELLAFDVCWENYLARHNLDFMDVWYEDLVKDFQSKILEIYSFLDIKNDSPPQPLLRRQADATSEEWYRRFLDSTDWLHEKNIQEALDRGDSLRLFLNRFMMLSRKKERLRWEEMPATRFKSVRRFYFRVRRKMISLTGYKK